MALLKVLLLSPNWKYRRFMKENIVYVQVITQYNKWYINRDTCHVFFISMFLIFFWILIWKSYTCHAKITKSNPFFFISSELWQIWEIHHSYPILIIRHNLFFCAILYENSHYWSIWKILPLSVCLKKYCGTSCILILAAIVILFRNVGIEETLKQHQHMRNIFPTL